MARDYAWEKLFNAVLGMARSERSLHERLKNAYWDHIMHIKPDDLPDDEARETLAQIGRQINSSTPVSDSEVRALIEKIVSLYDQMALYGPNGPQNVLTK
jgi:heptaprenylglyceryl phosphate synthase